jgi:tetratricopeptide (TPR) repeat protein
MLLRFLFFCFLCVHLNAQPLPFQKLDSLNAHLSSEILSGTAISRSELQNAIGLSAQAKYAEGAALAYKNYGNFYYFQAKHDSAILFLEKGIRSLKEPYSPVRSRLLMNLGVNNEKLYRFEEAISYYLQALKVSKHNADSSSVAITYQNLAQVKSRVQDYSEAKLALDSCLEWAPSLGFNKAAVYSSLGSILNSLGDTSSSINSYQKALKTWPVNRNLREKAVLLNNYSNVLIQQKKFNEARENYSAARIVF